MTDEVSAPSLALVTGGTRRVGAAIAARLARDGWRLALHARGDRDLGDALATTVREHRTDWACFVADFEDPAAPETLLGEVIGHFGVAPTLLVNCAASFDPADWRASDAATLMRSMAVNCIAPVALARAVTLAAGDAPMAVVNIVDQRVAQPVPDQFAYSIAKQALWQATRTLAVALAPRVRVNAVAPGPVMPGGDYAPGQWERIGAMLPLGVHPAPEAIAEAVLYLAHAEAVTGQTIFVDGGASLRGWERDFVYF